MAFSLPPAGVGSCIKGYYHAKRFVKYPLIGDITEFSIRWVILMFGILVLIPAGVSIYLLISVSMLTAELSSCGFYLYHYIKDYREFSKLPETGKRIAGFGAYMKLNLPIILSGYVTMTMSALNDALVPVALLEYHADSSTAMSEYGLFESIIIPAVFYPSFILTSLQTLIIPEIARANAAENRFRVTYLIDKLFKKTLMFSVFVSALLLTGGDAIGKLLCPSDMLVADTLRIMFFVVPFIYMEIILEGILRGLGKQGFSTLNSLAEYIIRIVTVVICTHFLGFWGVLVSYYASNIFSNIARVVMVCKTVQMRFNIFEYIVKPVLSAVFCVVCAGAGAAVLFRSGGNIKLIGFLVLSVIFYITVNELNDKHFTAPFSLENTAAVSVITQANG
jgi:stage V sporulation protein B